MPALLLVSRDLMFASRIESAAARLGARCDTVDDAAQAGTKLADAKYSLMICDLTAPGPVADLIAALPDAADEGRPRVIAFGPHVQTARLEEARAAGCDEVLTRGRFDATLDEILQRHFAA